MIDEAAREKWNAIYAQAATAQPPACGALLDFQHLLPARGVALELACGLGANALLLARRGLTTQAWDISDRAINRLQAIATAENLPLLAAARDVTANPPPPAAFDVVVVSHFLDRSLIPALRASLRSGGLCYYQTFITEVTPSYSGPSNPAFRLRRNELLELFSGMIVRAYREEGIAGDIQMGFRNEALIVAQAP